MPPNRDRGVVARFVRNAYRDGSNKLQDQINQAMEEIPRYADVVSLDVDWGVGGVAETDVACVVIRWERVRMSEA